jgi:hypothetical protein
MVLVLALHNLSEPSSDLIRAMVLPVLKLCFEGTELRNHPFLRRNAPDVKGSAAREVSTEMREPQERKGLGFSLATPLSLSDGEPPELDLLRAVEVNDLVELKRQGLSIKAIGAATGFDRKTIRKYLVKPDAIPAYAPRPPRSSKLDAFKPCLEGRLNAGVWNAIVLLRELKDRGYRGGYTILKDWLHPQRSAAHVAAVRRFETPPGRQAQVDWGHLGSLEIDGVERQMWGFTFTLGQSRAMMAEAALDQKLGTLLRMREVVIQGALLHFDLGGIRVPRNRSPVLLRKAPDLVGDGPFEPVGNYGVVPTWLQTRNSTGSCGFSR